MGLKSEPLVTVTMPLSRWLVCDEDHGGYRAGHCLACKRHGWLDVPKDYPNGVKHELNCPVGIAIEASQGVKR